MRSLVYTISKSDKDLLGILELQRKNHSANLLAEEISTQGFVTVIHSLENLRNLNDIQPHIICKNNGKVIAYLLAMTAKSRNEIPVLIPMFKIFETLIFKGKLISEYNYVVVGQVCVDKNYRGMGVLDKCYSKYKLHLKDKYDFAITEISSRNSRSINAHKRIGFSEIYKYVSHNQKEWSVVVLEW
jgi:hypothetical protein